MRDIRFLLKSGYSGSRALIIGIDRYKNASPLSYAVSDAEEIKKVLKNEFSFLEEYITYLINEEATKDAIYRAFMAYAKDDIDIDEKIVIFFAGHGHTRTGIRGEVGYLVPHDADMNDFSTFIRWDELTRNSELIRAKHMLFVMDACYSGLALSRHSQAGSTRFLKDMMLRYSRQVITAGKADEVVSDAGGPIPNHSVFTGHLIEGLRGKAASIGSGVITASGLMAYVYGKVANDKNSNQTPHYGYFDGDGDFIFSAPQLSELEAGEKTGLDRLIEIPSADEFISEDGEHKIKTVKRLLASNSSFIELHDYMVSELRRFLAATSEDNFKSQGTYSQQELLERISRYEVAAIDLAILSACIAYWGRPEHAGILQKILTRSTDRLGPEAGLTAWINLRWYPLIFVLYCSGIAAVDAKRYDSLAEMFYTRVGKIEYDDQDGNVFVEAASRGVSNLIQHEVFKKVPGHERHYVPMSEYFFKTLQPHLDDVLFVGMGYENAFDEFEVLFALAVADIKKAGGNHVWGPVGRFGWKQRQRANGPLKRIITEALAMGNEWAPLRAGLFGGDFDRFKVAAEEYQQRISSLSWY